MEREALEAGAAGFVAKGTSLEDLLSVLREALPEAAAAPRR